MIPIRLRGRLQAWRNLTGGLIAAVLSYFAGDWLVAHHVLGNGYATTFMLSFILTSLGLTMLPPSLISMPFKLLLFVLIDGWFLTVGMLLESVRVI